MANNNAKANYKKWFTDTKPDVGPIIQSCKKAMEQQTKKAEKANPAAAKQGAGKAGAKPASGSGGTPAGLTKPKPDAGVTPSSAMPN